MLVNGARLEGEGLGLTIVTKVRVQAQTKGCVSVQVLDLSSGTAWKHRTIAVLKLETNST